MVDKSHISNFPQRGSGEDTRGIRLQPNPNPHELDIASKHWDGKLDTSYGISKLNYITNLIAHPRDLRQHIFTKGWGIRLQYLKNCLIGNFPWVVRHSPLGENNDEFLSLEENNNIRRVYCVGIFRKCHTVTWFLTIETILKCVSNNYFFL